MKVGQPVSKCSGLRMRDPIADIYSFNKYSVNTPALTAISPFSEKVLCKSQCRPKELFLPIVPKDGSKYRFNTNYEFWELDCFDLAQPIARGGIVDYFEYIILWF